MDSSVATDLILYDVKPTGKEIGRGAYGRVFEVNYQGTLCAAKEIHALLLKYSEGDAFRKITTDFLNECKIWSTIRHPGIVQVLGMYYPDNDQYRLPVMVMEKMESSLRGLVETYSDIPLNVKLSILDEVCLGLRYLHSRSPPIVHRDLTPNNILMGSRLEAKISDLGVAKVMQADKTSSMTKIPGTPDYMSPEAVTKKPVYGPPLDVFSYGGVVLYVITQQWPGPADAIQFNPETGRREVVSEVTRRQMYLDKMTRSAVNIKPLVISCLDDDPNNRPLVAQVSTEIKKFKELSSRLTSHDGVSPIVWWAEICGQSSPHVQQEQVATLTSQVKKMTIGTKVLRDMVASHKNESDALKMENKNLREEVKDLREKVDSFEAEIDKVKMENKQLQIKNQQLKHTFFAPKLEKCESPPVPPRFKKHITSACHNKDTNKSGELKGVKDAPTTDGPVNIKWHEAAPAPVGYAHHTAVFHDGKVYIGGGYETGGKTSYRIDIYSPSSNSWSPSPIIAPYCQFSMTTLNNQLIIAGGKDKDTRVTNKIFQLHCNQFREYTEMDTPRCCATVVGYRDALIVAGGRGDHQELLTFTELFDSTTGQWYDTDKLPLPHSQLKAIVIKNTLFFLGGDNPDGMSPAVFSTPLGTYQVKWSCLQDTPWGYSSPINVQDKHLLVIGGWKKTDNVRTNDIYFFNTVSQNWEALGKIPSATYASAAVNIIDDIIILVGGYKDKRQYTNRVWIGLCK